MTGEVNDERGVHQLEENWRVYSVADSVIVSVVKVPCAEPGDSSGEIEG
jgi:hypothetical protein